MADRLTETIRGIVPTSVRWRPENLTPNDGGALNSDYTEKDPRPGTAVTADSRARLRPEISQAQDAGTIVFKVTEGGLPGPIGAAVSYRLDSEPADSERGWNQPNYLSGWVAQEWSDVLDFGDVACVTLPATQEVVAIALTTPATEPAGGSSRSRVFDPETWIWTAGSVPPWRIGIQPGQQTTALVHLPGTDRILAIVLPADVALPSSTPMTVYDSIDKGATWAPYSLRPIRDPAAEVNGSGFVGVKRGKAAAMSDGSVVCLVEDNFTTEGIAQLGSADLGVTFALVEAPQLGTNVDVFALPDGTFAVTFIEKTSLLPRIRFLGSAFDSLGDAVQISIASAQLDSLTATIDADGTIYAFGNRTTNFNRSFLWFSTDLGRTWSEYKFGLTDTGDVGAFPIFLGSCATGGQILIQHRWSVSSGNEDNSVGTMIAGGWSNLVLFDDSFPITDRSVDMVRPFERFGYGGVTGIESNTWIPIELPSDTIYTTATPGALVAPGEMTIATVAAAAAQGFVTATGLDDSVTQAQFRVTVGGSQVIDAVGFQWIFSDGAANSYRYTIRADTAGFAIFDTNAAANVGSAVVVGMAINIQIKVDVSFDNLGANATLRSYYRRPGDTVWIAGPAGALSNGGFLAPLSAVTFGHNGASTSTSFWQMFEWALEGGVGFGADKVDGKRIADLPYPLSGVGNKTTGEKALLSLRAGPGTRGEIYEIAAEADHAVSKLFPTVSPSRDDTFETLSNTLTRVSVDMVRDSRLGQSFALVMGVLNSNVRRIQLFGDIAAVPTLIGELDLATGFVGLQYLLTGDQLTPSLATADAARWIQAMEFVGGHVDLGGGVVRRIAANSAGGWTTAPTVVPHFRLEGIDGTENVTGFCDIVAPSGFVVFHMATTPSKFRRFYQVEIPAGQDTVEGRYRVGNVLLGGLVVPGKQWSNGWALSYAGNVRSRRDPYGTEYREQRGPEARTYTVGFADGVKMQHTRESLDVAYIGSSAVGASALAGRDDVLGQLVGLLRESEGFSAPSMLLAEVPDASGVTVTDPTLWVYGYLTGTVQANHVTGDENSREFYRIEQLQLVEVR